MRFSILLPHYKTGKMTAYTISQLLKYKGTHDIDIFVINNNSGDESEKYLEPFKDDIKYFEYPKDKLQSHGVAFDWIIPSIETEYFITIESDSFPTKEGWLDYYENLINEGFQSGGSVLKLSGGKYMHPCGAFYKKSVWEEAKKYCDEIQYAYFPNMALKEGFECHLMVHKDICGEFLKTPSDYIELGKGYKELSISEKVEKMLHYSPIVGPFHNGMGKTQESVKTYGNRNIESEVPNILLDNKQKLICRIGYEPGQFLSYYMLATEKKVFFIPTETKWLPNRENQQQEYTLMENGFKHIWGVSAYCDWSSEEIKDISIVKQSTPEQLYETLPDNQKIKIC